MTICSLIVPLPLKDRESHPLKHTKSPSATLILAFLLTNEAQRVLLELQSTLIIRIHFAGDLATTAGAKVRDGRSLSATVHGVVRTYE